MLDGGDPVTVHIPYVVIQSLRSQVYLLLTHAGEEIRVPRLVPSFGHGTLRCFFSNNRKQKSGSVSNIGEKDAGNTLSLS